MNFNLTEKTVLLAFRKTLIYLLFNKNMLEFLVYRFGFTELVYN